MKNTINTAAALSALLLTASFLSGCNKDDKSPDITGTWVTVSVNGLTLQENDRFVNTFTADGRNIFASLKTDRQTGSGEWIVEPTPTGYHMTGDVLNEEGETYAGAHFIFRSQVSVGGDVMMCRMLEHTQDGVAQSVYSQTVRKRVHPLYDQQIVGVWKGRDPSPGSRDAYWHFKADGSYDYYYYDETSGAFIRKADNNGKYFLYGDLLFCNFTNDLRDGTQGRRGEGWSISISGNVMAWYADRGESGKISFGMARSTLPL